MASVNVENLCVRLGSSEIIHNLSLEVQDREFLVLLGPSGCGKSTLLHSIAGLLEVADGHVEIGGQDMTWADPSERNIGMVFQSYALYPTMTVERNMSFGLRITGTPKDEIERRVARVAHMLQLESLLKRKPAQLSGGQRQRVAIGRALVREAGVFLFDEPLSNLDAKLRAELRRELKLLHQKLQATMIYVTHDQVEAMTLATRIVVMQGGKIQQIGSPREVYERPENLFVAGFLGAPSMNFLKGKIMRMGDVLHFQAPENVCLHDAGAWQGVVSLIEPMGNHHVVWFDFAGQLFSSLGAGNCSLHLGDEIRFDLDSAAISLFDDTSALRL
ncbi:MAG: ABC transporter ATP-binding protein [Burkholderiales bacterium]|nr:ABC transporter ATP-binding protein [Burkholderiales bacterium]